MSTSRIDQKVDCHNRTYPCQHYDEHRSGVQPQRMAGAIHLDGDSTHKPRSLLAAIFGFRSSGEPDLPSELLIRFRPSFFFFGGSGSEVGH